MAEKKPFEAGLIARITGAIKVAFGQAAAIDNGSEWFGPLNPTVPTVPEVQKPGVLGRQMDYATGYNIRQQPRSGEAVTFAQMRALADNCDVLRLVIETRKDQIAKFEFAVKPIDDKKKDDPRCKEVMDFFRLPDGENNWHDWLRQLMEEMLVTDAATVYPWLKQGGAPYRFELMDGSTVKRVIDVRGRTPAPPQPAYQQVLKGLPAVDYSADELVYAPRNKRVHKVYGYSPVEQIIMTVNIAMRRALHQLQYYTDGSTPDLLFQVPADWTMGQIKEFNDWWQDSLSGNTAARRKAQFVPNGVTPLNTKEAILKDPYDEWLARIICYAFSVSAQPFVKENNRSTAETAHVMALEEGLFPILLWIKGLVDKLIWKYFGYTDLEFTWGDEKALSRKEQSEIDDRNLKNGTANINEVRARRGDTSIGPEGDKFMVLTATGYVPVFTEPPAEPAATAPAIPGSTQDAPLDPSKPEGDSVQPGAPADAADGKKKEGEQVEKINDCHDGATGQFCTGGGGGRRLFDKEDKERWVTETGERQLPKSMSGGISNSPLLDRPDGAVLPLAAMKPGTSSVRQQAPVKPVEVDHLHSAQDTVEASRLQPWTGKSEPIEVVQLQGKLWVTQGNHRAASAWAAGAKTIDAHVLNLDDPKNAKHLKAQYKNLAKMDSTDIQKSSKDVPLIDRESKAHKKITNDLAAGIKKQFETLLKTLADNVVNKVAKLGATGADPLSGIVWKGWEEIQDLFGKQLALSAKLGVKGAYAQLNLDNKDLLNLANEDAIKFAEQRAAELVGKQIRDGQVVDNPNPDYSIEDATREMIRADVTTAMEQGLSNDDLAAMLEENYAFSELRAETIARTETAFADCQGNMVVYRDSGVVDKKRWIVGADCCPECEEVDGEIVDLDENFSNGIDAPPAHPNCRCDFIPILNEDE